MSNLLSAPPLPPLMRDNITDFHTHTPLKPNAIINRYPGDERPGGYYYSVGIHPWYSFEVTPQMWRQLEIDAAAPEVIAIGECGIDKLRGADISLQAEIFRRHILLSEALGKPLIIHCVRAIEQIERLRTEMRPTQPWILHGFRGKPRQAHQLLSRGYYLSTTAARLAALRSELPNVAPFSSQLLPETDDQQS